MTEPDIESLAQRLAWKFVYAWQVSDQWYGYPDGEEEEREAMENYLPRAREEAREMAKLLGVLDD